jgi:hypothetical protein
MLRGSSCRARLAGRRAPDSGCKPAPPLLGSVALWLPSCRLLLPPLPPLLQVSFATEACVTGGKQQGQAEGAGDVLTRSEPSRHAESTGARPIYAALRRWESSREIADPNRVLMVQGSPVRRHS